MQRLVANLISATGINALSGSVVADESVFDSRRGTPATGYAPNIEVEGELSGACLRPRLGQQRRHRFLQAPCAGRRPAVRHRPEGGRSQGARAWPASPPAAPRPTPSCWRWCTRPASPHLIALTNTPSDNYFAETLIKDLGARFGAAGTTAAGAAVVRTEMATVFGIHPRLNDGSGLSRYDRVDTARHGRLCCASMAANANFTKSLAVAGRTGTLVDEMRGTPAQGRCRGKTGSLHDVSNVVGYCLAQDGHTLAYAFMMNGIVPDYAHPIQDQMQVALATYDG